MSVWADTAAEAAGKALVGTIGVTFNGTTQDYTFGPTTVGASAADQKPFLVQVSGNSVSLAFEDMAGQAGCDYDYNDRSWSGVTVAGATDPVIYQGTFLWSGSPGGGTAQVKVTAETENTYKWNYHVLMTLFCIPNKSGTGGLVA